MQQQINLYHLLHKESKFALTTKMIIISYSLFILLIILFHVLQLWQRHKLQMEETYLENEITLQQKTLTSLTQQYPVTDIDSLKISIKNLQKVYSVKMRTIDILSPFANFSKYLRALGNAIVPGVWLTHITFNRGATKMALQGRTEDPAFLSQFYNQLAQQSVFAHLIFKLNNIKQKKYPASFYITATEEPHKP